MPSRMLQIAGLYHSVALGMRSDGLGIGTSMQLLREATETLANTDTSR